jgi:flagellar basal-body rod modification protein FlgD
VQASAAGDVDFEWNGLDPAGNAAAPGSYTISAQLGATKLDTQIASRIDSISYTANGIVLNLDGHDNITFDQILSIQ